MAEAFGGPSGRIRPGLGHQFGKVPQADIPRSQFDRSHGLKTTFDAGYIVPILRDLAFPGDTFSCRMMHFGRIVTLLRPIMHRVHLDVHFFAVPIRLVWDNWEKFNGAQDDPADAAGQGAFLVPQMTSPASVGYDEMSLHDYLGIPPNVPDLAHSSLWHRAYNLIFNEWYRDQNLIDSLVVDTDDGPDDPADYVLKRRGKRYDYFTGCLPFAQKGDAVELPLGTSAPVSGTISPTGTTQPSWTDGTTQSALAMVNAQASADWSTTPSSNGNVYWQDPALSLTSAIADLSSATAATINSIRLAFQTQRLLERDARGGTRYTEIIRAHFGVISDDQRLQRPEFFGGRFLPA